MDNADLIAVSRLIAQQNAMDVRANNIANANTPGFQASRILFSDYLANQTGAKTPQGGGILTYTEGNASYRDQTIGPITQTGNPLDLALAGNGYFTVKTANGVRLTRNGHFELGSDGTITDASGDALLDSGGQPLQLAPNDIDPVVSGDGTITAQGGAIGQIAVVMPADPTKLTAEGNSLLSADATTTTAVTAPRVEQGTLEGSNVEPVTETTGMMNELREFQFVTQFIEAENQRQQDAIDRIASTDNS